MSNTARMARLLKASDDEYKNDPFGKVLADLERINRECSQATDEFLQASRELRADIEGIAQ